MPEMSISEVQRTYQMVLNLYFWKAVLNNNEKPKPALNQSTKNVLFKKLIHSLTISAAQTQNPYHKSYSYIIRTYDFYVTI